MQGLDLIPEKLANKHVMFIDKMLSFSSHLVLSYIKPLYSFLEKGSFWVKKSVSLFIYSENMGFLWVIRLPLI